MHLRISGDMEGQIIQITMGQIIGVISALVGVIGVLAGAVFYIYKRGERKNTVIVDLTKEFVSVTKDHAKAIENNTKVVEGLPEQIMLHIKAMK